MTWEQQKAKELIGKFLNQPINFPYIDSEDGQCIGEGYMTHDSAKQCAIITAKEVREETKKDEFYPSGGLLHHRVVYQEKWNNVIKEIEKL